MEYVGNDKVEGFPFAGMESGRSSILSAQHACHSSRTVREVNSKFLQVMYSLGIDQSKTFHSAALRHNNATLLRSVAVFFCEPKRSADRGGTPTTDAGVR
jgi:hypothetical protein